MSTEFDRKVELLRIWYAAFVGIIDCPDTPEKDLWRLRKLRTAIRHQAPELDVPENAADAKSSGHN
jgi:hypothetical protein